MAILLDLFWSFFQIGAFSVGGGLAALPLIQHQVVDVHGWMTMTDFANIVTISEMTPGPIALNSATFVGTQVAGISGAVIATLGCITPSCILVLSIAYFFFKYNDLKVVQGILGGLRPAVVSLIASAGIGIFSLSVLQVGRIDSSTIASINIDYVAAALFVYALVAIRRFKMPPIMAMMSCGVIGLLLYNIPNLI